MTTIKGPPKDWKLDAGQDDQQQEMEDGGPPYEGEGVETPKGSRTGERRSIYLKRSDFEKYGHTDGRPRCRDMATQRPGPSSGGAAHTSACRGRIEENIQKEEPIIWDI